VSAIIPTYNRRNYIFRAIDSVLGQTAPVDEIIVVDDGSTDGTVESIRDRYGPRVAVFRQDNMGVSAARTRGIEEARGEWIAFLDSDDVWLPTKLERQFEALTKLGSEFGACFTNCTLVGDPNIKLSAFDLAGLERHSKFGSLNNPEEYALAKYQVIAIQSVLVLRSLLTELNGFDRRLFVGEDSDLVLRLTFKTRFCYVSEPQVEIERTVSRQGLNDSFIQMNDRTYGCLRYKYEKWLALPELVDLRTRAIIHDNLRDLLYGWTISELYRLRLAGVFQRIRDLRALGDGYVDICRTLMLRAARKAARTLRGLSKISVGSRATE
jgi:glycosyltransferase involved in cell wall biosynthesis